MTLRKGFFLVFTVMLTSLAQARTPLPPPRPPPVLLRSAPTLRFTPSAPPGVFQKQGTRFQASSPNLPRAQPSVADVVAYLESLRRFTSDFIQHSANGAVRYTGRLYVQRPGRLRFAYDAPSPLDIVADGRSVAIRDRRLNTQDVYFINQTPLKFILSNQVTFSKNMRLGAFVHRDGETILTIVDSSTIGGASRIQLFFNSLPLRLKRWIITDPQGYDTSVEIRNIDRSRSLDPKLFYIQEGRIL